MGRRDRRVERLQAQIGRLKGELAAAKERIAELEAKLRQNSSNTSRPPSSDGPGNKPKRDRPKGKAKRKRGGQPGHAKHERPLVPVECVQRVIDLKPEVCGKCDKRLEGEDPEPHRHQVWELPEITPEITEYREHSRLCDCGHTTRGTLPPGVPAGAFGPRAMAFIAMLTGRFRISKREAAELCAEGLGLPICAGSVSKVEQTVSEAIAAPVDEAREHVREQRQANIDETGWKEGNKKAWLWAAATMFVAVFTVDLSRGSSVAKQILGDSWNGVINSDRWSAYSWISVDLRQLCWSHLMRDFKGMIDRGGGGSRIGRKLLGQAKLMFKWWHKVRDGTMTRRQFQRKMRTIRAEVGRLLRAGSKCSGKKTAGMCKEMLKVEAAFWTFVDIEGIEPTNNHGERVIRPPVLWRKGSFGTQGPRGSRYVERILTVCGTLRLQRRAIHGYLTEAVDAKLRGTPAPSILPRCEETLKRAA